MAPLKLLQIGIIAEDPQIVRNTLAILLLVYISVAVPFLLLRQCGTGFSEVHDPRYANASNVQKFGNCLFGSSLEMEGNDLSRSGDLGLHQWQW
jgi:hypothetical protein